MCNANLGNHFDVGHVESAKKKHNEKEDMIWDTLQGIHMLWNHDWFIFAMSSRHS